MQLQPAEYQYQIAKQRMSELAQSRQAATRSKQSLRRALASGLRKLADWVEPALAMRVPTQRRAT